MDLDKLLKSQIEKIIQRKEARTLSALRLDMDTAIKNKVLPFLRQNGFKGSYPHLRRIQTKEVHAITFQFDKWGGSFVIELGKCPISDKIIPNTIRAWDCDGSIDGTRQRLGKLSHGQDYWYRYDDKPDNAKIFEVMAEEVISDYQKYAEAWFRSTVIPKEP